VETITTTLGISTTVYLYDLPSGGQAAVVAQVTFGQLILAFLLLMIVGLQAVRLVKEWRY
jgi:hypothetical protein